MPLLEKLGQRGFNKCRCRPQQGDDPHPEHGAGTSDGNGCCHTSEVACSHTRGNGNGESLERGYVLVSLVAVVKAARSRGSRVGQQPEHFAYHAELHPLGLKSEPYSTKNQCSCQHITPYGIIHLCNCFVH